LTLVGEQNVQIRNGDRLDPSRARGWAVQIIATPSALAFIDYGDALRPGGSA
jgi:hypothetical protein